MRVILFGLGTIGAAVQRTLEAHEHEVVTVSRERGQLRADLTNAGSLRAVFERVGTFHGVACAAGDVFPGPIEQATDEQWAKSFASKAMGQINVVRAGLPFLADKGSFTLVSGILADEPIAGGLIGATINGTIEGFVRAAAFELPRGIRINCSAPRSWPSRLRTTLSFLAFRRSPRRKSQWRTCEPSPPPSTVASSSSTRLPEGARRNITRSPGA
jgi:NAD(P)-dependent dehydrogenase (short-subunit alcohol dehydrogenase family)